MTGNHKGFVETAEKLHLAPLELRPVGDGLGVSIPTEDGVLEVAHATAPTTAAPNSAYVRFAKPVMDFLGALVLVVLTAPVLLVAMAAIKVTMGGPVVFKQQRVGRGGEPFTLYKLRTMRDDPEYLAASLRPDETGRIRHKVGDDPRITPLGRTLRKWNIDELPQFVNVLKGQMSLVGPRPELVEIVGCYRAWQHRRHLVKPGITGLWQVTARNHGPMHEATEIDLEYVRDVSLGRDLYLLLATVPASLGQRPGI